VFTSPIDCTQYVGAKNVEQSWRTKTTSESMGGSASAALAQRAVRASVRSAMRVGDMIGLLGRRLRPAYALRFRPDVMKP
jgi:hypothetical protein